MSAAFPWAVVRSALLVVSVVAPCVVLLAAVFSGVGTDFDTNVWAPAQAIRAGISPYPPPQLEVLIEPTFLYPPMLLGLDLLLSPFGHDGARVLFWLLQLTSVVGALRLLDVTDRRVYLVSVLSYPVWVGQALGNPTLLLLAPMAAAWRWRDHPWAAGAAVGIAGAFKLILWPLGLWLLLTGRIRSAALAATGAVLLVLAPWAAIGFDGLADYPELLRIFGEQSGAPRSFTVSTLLERLGAPDGPAHAVRWALGAVFLVATIVVSRREDGDRRSFALAIATVLVISPVVERVYLATLIVPLAVARPMFGPMWKAFGALWLVAVIPSGPRHGVVADGRLLLSHGFLPSLGQLAVVGAVIVAVVAVTARADKNPSARQEQHDGVAIGGQPSGP